MILMQDLFLRVNTDLVKKGLGGFANNSTFNRAVNEAQVILMEYYAEKYRFSQNLADAVLPFLETADIAITSGTFSFPSDYRHLLSAAYISYTNSDGEPVETETILNESLPNEQLYAYRKPTLGKPKTYKYELGAVNKIKPSTLAGKVRVTYLRVPAEASRAVTNNVTTDDEDYNAGSTVNLEWPSHEFVNFVDLLMFAKGVEIRETDLVNWVAGRNQFAKTEKI